MQIKIRYIPAILFFCILFSGSMGQSNFSINVQNLKVNFKQNINYPMLSTNLDRFGMFVFEPGIIIAFEKYFLEDHTAVKISEGGYLDAAGKAAGFTSLGLQWRVIKKRKDFFHISLAPTYHYRSTWENNGSYIKDKSYTTKGKLQTWISVGAGLEYSHQFSKNGDFSISLGVAIPVSIQLNVGYKFWFERKTKKDCGC